MSDPVIVIVPAFHAFKAEIARADSLLAMADRLGMEAAGGRELLRQANDQLLGLRAEIHSFSLEPIQAALSERTTIDPSGPASSLSPVILRSRANRKNRVGLRSCSAETHAVLLRAEGKDFCTGRTPVMPPPTTAIDFMIQISIQVGDVKVTNSTRTHHAQHAPPLFET